VGSKRIYILSDEEIKQIYDLPKFSHDEREIFFELDVRGIRALNNLRGASVKIHFILQCGYFKAKQRIFEFNYSAVKDDVAYINERYGLDAKITKSLLVNINKTLSNKRVLKQFGFSEFDGKNKNKIIEYAITLARRIINQATIFTEVMSRLNEQRIMMPAYTVMQDMVSMVMTLEEKRLGNIIDEHLPDELSEKLIKMLDSKENLNLTAFRRMPKNFKYSEFKEEVERGEKYRDTYFFTKRFLKKASISEYNIKHYASIAEKHKIAQLKQIKTTNAKLYLLCYIYYRYQQTNDNLIICYCYYGHKFADECKKFVLEKLLEHSRKYESNLPKVSKLLRFMGDYKSTTMEHTDFMNKANNILDKKEYEPTADYMDGISFNEKAKMWEHYDKISNKIKKYSRPAIRQLDFEYDKSIKPIEEVTTFLKTKLLRKKFSLKNVSNAALPTAFIRKSDLKFLSTKEGKKVSYNKDRYEIYANIRLLREIEKGKVHCNESIKHKSLKADLLPDEIWKNKDKLLKSLGYKNITVDVDDRLDELEKALHKKIIEVNKNIENGNNKYFKKDGDNWNLTYQSKGEEINHKFFETIEKKSVVEVMHYVNALTGFCEPFTHIKSRYIKNRREDDYIIACIIADGLGHGSHAMGQSSDISISSLLRYEANYLTVDSLKKSNDILSNKIKVLPIFKEWNILLDKLMGSADGQKHESKYNTLQSRHSRKYFGLKKGIVGYNFVVNHVAVNSQIISPNEHESHYLFDIVYNNNSEIDPEVITGDMHSINCLNYTILDAINKEFAPNFNSPQDQTIATLKPLSIYNDLYLKPKRVINRKLIKDEWDNIQRVFSSLVTG